MIELINKRLARESRQTLDPSDYSYLNTDTADDSPHQKAQSSFLSMLAASTSYPVLARISPPKTPNHQFTPINAPKELHLVHAFRIVQHLATRSMGRWSQRSFALVMQNDHVFPIHEGSPRAHSWAHCEIRAWWQLQMTELINEQLTQEGHPALSSDDFSYLNG